jgi:tRNA-specific 2-thiouridylase
VVKLDAGKRRVIVGPRAALAVSRIALRDVNWIGEDVADAVALDGRDVLVRVRSTRPPVRGMLRVEGADGPPSGARAEAARWSVILDESEEGVAPGQAAVFYEPGGTRVLGGGWIARAGSGA